MSKLAGLQWCRMWRQSDGNGWHPKYSFGHEKGSEQHIGREWLRVRRVKKKRANLNDRSNQPHREGGTGNDASMRSGLIPCKSTGEMRSDYRLVFPNLDGRSSTSFLPFFGSINISADPLRLAFTKRAFLHHINGISLHVKLHHVMITFCVKERVLREEL